MIVRLLASNVWMDVQTSPLNMNTRSEWANTVVGKGRLCLASSHSKHYTLRTEELCRVTELRFTQLRLFGGSEADNLTGEVNE